MTRSIPILLAAGALATGLGACGGEAGAGTTAREDGARATRDAGLRYARCMREQGIDMPDPRTDENGVAVVGGGPDGLGADGGRPSSRVRAAERACRRYLKDIPPPKLSAEDQREFREQALAHARCMRRNGVEFPDPTFGQDGGAVVDIGPGSGLDPSSPAFKRAGQACRELMGAPGAAPGGSGS